MLLRIAPLLFVLLWSTGFIASKVSAEHAEPFTFLVVRFLLVVAILLPVAYSVPRPSLAAARDAAIAGMLIHTGYLGGVMIALTHGMPAGVVAIIVCLQPVVTALLAGPLLGERITPRNWAGLAVGLAGVSLVVAPKIGFSAADVGAGLSTEAVLGAVIGLVGITFGTLFQKARGHTGDLRALAFFQYLGALAAAAPLAFAMERMDVDWTIEFALALGWLVLVLSLGAIGLLLLLIRASAVSRVTSLFYLVPATTALLAWALFGESLSALQLVGVVLVMAAVMLTGGLRRA